MTRNEIVHCSTLRMNTKLATKKIKCRGVKIVAKELELRKPVNKLKK